MKKANRLILLLLLITVTSFAQQQDSIRQQYMNDLRILGRNFSRDFYPNKATHFALPEKKFVHKIDSSRQLFLDRLNAYSLLRKETDAAFISDQQKEINYFFDQFLIDYPYFHEVSTGKKKQLSPTIQKRLHKNIADFNNPAMLRNEDFKAYARSFLRHQSSAELKKPAYKKGDNKRLTSTIMVIKRVFTNTTCRDFWQYDYISTHIDDSGVKNLATIINDFNNTCTDTSYKRKINDLYNDAKKERENCLTKTYKTINGYDLDIHLFLSTVDSPGRRPAFVFFSGGSWTTGNPEWSFYNCREYAKKGWVGVAVEYRLADRHGTTPFEAVMDARSAIRWLRKHADEFNLDTARIVATGNSAGGHLVLATALADKWNETTDDLLYSPVPNLLLINAGVYDFIADENTLWIRRDLKNKNTVKEISPVHLVKEGLPPMLIIHGTSDQSVPYLTAQSFEAAMKKTKNQMEFLTLEGAPHAMWFDRRFTPRIAAARREFLKKYGYSL